MGKTTLRSSICAIVCRKFAILCLMNCGKPLKQQKTTTRSQSSARKKLKNNWQILSRNRDRLVQAQVTLAGLESAATAYRKLYDGFLQQYMGSTQQATFPITEARVISTASPPLQKSKPKTILVLALSLVGGLGLGVGLGVLRDQMDRVFRTAKQLEAELQVPCVALVPLVKDEKAKQPWHQAILDRYTDRKQSNV